MLDGRGKIVDELTILRASARLASSAYCTYDGATPTTIDTGGGYTEGKLIVDVAAVASNWTTAASNQQLEFAVRGSNFASFDHGYVRLATLRIGRGLAAANDLRSGGDYGASGSPGVGRYKLPFTNDFCGTIYRYLRCKVLVGGTSALGQTFSVFMTK